MSGPAAASEIYVVATCHFMEILTGDDFSDLTSKHRGFILSTEALMKKCQVTTMST